MKDNWELLNDEFIALSRRFTTDKKLGGLDRSSYTVLNHLAKHGESGVKAMAGEFRLDISTVSRQASALETSGYAHRVPDPQDGRSILYQITELGTRKLEEAKAMRIDRYRQLLKDWTPEEREIFGTLLARLNRTYLE